MIPERLDGFVDPATGAPLRLEHPHLVGGHVESGTLLAADGARFPIAAFVPRFVPQDNYAKNFGLQWQLHQRTQLDSHTGTDYSRRRLFATTGWPADLTGQRVLEAGSGAGRFTEVLATTGADIASFDYSEATVANYQTNGQNRNVTIFQGDIYRIPFPPRSFDKVICLGVLQHTPDVERSFRSLADMVRPGGQLVVDVYPRRLRAMLHWKYALRPLATRLAPDTLYRVVSWYAPKLMPVAKLARRLAGRAGHRLIPILDQSDKDVSPELQRDWTILDTYDALSPRYDQPQTAATLRDWFEAAGFVDVEVAADVPDTGGLFGRGRRPA